MGEVLDFLKTGNRVVTFIIGRGVGADNRLLGVLGLELSQEGS